jgi:hypothetical protein
MPDMPRQQKQEKESILELLGRGFASGAGQSLGTGLGNLATQGLGMLMDPNMRPMNAQSLELLGLDPQQAQAIASIRNPAMQRDIVNSVQQRQQEMLEKDKKANRLQGYLKSMQGIMPQSVPQGQSQPGQQEAAAGPITADDLKDMEIADFDRIFKAAHKEREFTQKEKHADRAEIRQSHQDNKKFTSKGRERAESAEEGEGIVNAMESLENTGKVESGPWAELLSKHGLESFLNPESIAFEKLRATFLGGAKNVIGGRVTNQEMQQFMKSIPSLSQSPEGRAMIYANMRNKFELDKQYYQTIKDLEDEYEGKPLPHNFESMVSTRMKPHYKAFQDKFKTVGEMEKKKADNTFMAKPPASSLAGKTIQNRDGSFEWSDGKQWHKGKKPAQQKAVSANTDNFGFNANEY